MKRNRRAARNQVNVRTRFVQQAGQVNGRCARAQDRYPAPLELADVVVVRTMVEKLPWHFGEHGRNVSEVSYASSYHNALGAQSISGRGGELISTSNGIDRSHISFFYPRHKALLKRECVRDKGLYGNWQTHVRVGQRMLPAIVRQSKSGAWIV